MSSSSNANHSPTANEDYLPMDGDSKMEVAEKRAKRAQEEAATTDSNVKIVNSWIAAANKAVPT